jgi:hypothetical protein
MNSQLFLMESVNQALGKVPGTEGLDRLTPLRKPLRKRAILRPGASLLVGVLGLARGKIANGTTSAWSQTGEVVTTSSWTICHDDLVDRHRLARESRGLVRP